MQLIWKQRANKPQTVLPRYLCQPVFCMSETVYFVTYWVVLYFSVVQFNCCFAQQFPKKSCYIGSLSTVLYFRTINTGVCLFLSKTSAIRLKIRKFHIQLTPIFLLLVTGLESAALGFLTLQSGTLPLLHWHSASPRCSVKQNCCLIDQFSKNSLYSGNLLLSLIMFIFTPFNEI